KVATATSAKSPAPIGATGAVEPVEPAAAHVHPVLVPLPSPVAPLVEPESARALASALPESCPPPLPESSPPPLLASLSPPASSLVPGPESSPALLASLTPPASLVLPPSLPASPPAPAS